MGSGSERADRGDGQCCLASLATRHGPLARVYARRFACHALRITQGFTPILAIADGPRAAVTDALVAAPRVGGTGSLHRCQDDAYRGTVTLADCGPAPEFTGITGWLNSAPLSMAGLRGEVVLVETGDLIPADGEVIEKNPGDLVTVADREAEVLITQALTASYPKAVVLGEEAFAADPGLMDSWLAAEHTFTVDPVDGT